jgi:hypothetical protein
MAGRALSRGLLAAGLRIAELLALLVWYATLAAATALVLHIVLALLDANSANAIVMFLRRIAGWLVGPFRMLFTPKDPKEAVAINEGLAAAVYLAAGAAVSRGIRMLGGRFAR